MSASSRGKGQGGQGRKNRSSFNKSHFVYGASSGSKASDTQSSKNESFAEALKIPVIKPLKKSCQNFVMFLREYDKRLFSNPTALAKQYLELDQEIPVVSNKTREYYESILTETRSFKIVHVNKNPGSGRGPSEIQFSKAFVIGVLNFQDWGVNPNKPRFLNFLKMEYNYWDYIDAWSKAFFYQNSYNTHSWWFRFEALTEPTVDFKQLPHWFINWFHKFGPEEDFFEDKVLKVFKEYSKFHPKHQDDAAPILNMALLRFLGQYSIPWIFQWSYSVAHTNNVLMLMRDLFYKWWNKFEFEDQFKQMVIDVEGFKDYNRWVKQEADLKKQNALLNQEFKTPSVAQLKLQFPEASAKDIKKKLLEALAAQLDLLDEDEDVSQEDNMSTKSPSVMEEENEDMETRMEPISGKSWAQQVEEEYTQEDLGELIKRQREKEKLKEAKVGK